MTENNNKQAPLDELSRNVVDLARTGIYAAVGLTDKIVHEVNDEIRRQQEAARERRAKRSEQAEEIKNRAKNLPDEVRGWPEQVREGVEYLIGEARKVVEDLADHGRQRVNRFQGKSSDDEAAATVDEPTESSAGVGADSAGETPFADVEVQEPPVAGNTSTDEESPNL